MTFLQIGPKILTGVSNLTFQYQLIFNHADFASAMGNLTYIPENFSLAIVFYNSQPQTAYVGVQLETPRGIITIGDRDTIGHIPPLSTGYFSHATTPQFAHITEQVTRVIINIYFLFKENITVNQTSYALLRVDTPQSNLGPQPYIGRDFRAIEPGSNVCFYGDELIPNATNGFTVTNTFTSPLPMRYRIREIELGCYPTPFPGDLFVYCTVTDNASNVYVLCGLYSNTETYISQKFNPNYYIDSDEIVGIFADNVNSTNDYRAFGMVVGDYVL